MGLLEHGSSEHGTSLALDTDRPRRSPTTATRLPGHVQSNRCKSRYGGHEPDCGAGDAVLTKQTEVAWADWGDEHNVSPTRLILSREDVCEVLQPIPFPHEQLQRIQTPQASRVVRLYTTRTSSILQPSIVTHGIDVGIKVDTARHSTSSWTRSCSYGTHGRMMHAHRLV